MSFFTIYRKRTKIESEQKNKTINSIIRLDFVQKVRSKNIDQSNKDLVLELIAIDYLKNNEDYEINLIFNNNAFIALTTLRLLKQGLRIRLNKKI